MGILKVKFGQGRGAYLALDPDEAEAMGKALIQAARQARKEL